MLSVSLGSFYSRDCMRERENCCFRGLYGSDFFLSLNHAFSCVLR